MTKGAKSSRLVQSCRAILLVVMNTVEPVRSGPTSSYWAMRSGVPANWKAISTSLRSSMRLTRSQG